MKKFLALVLLALAPLVYGADNTIDGHLIRPGTLPTTAAIVPWASAASPTFTGTLTFPFTGSTQCLQVNTSGVVSGTGSACGSGGGGSFLPLAGGTMTGTATLHTANLDGTNLASGNSLTVTPIGNPLSTLSKISYHATTSSTATRSFMIDLGEISATSGGTGPTGGNVVLYTGMEAQSGTGDAWSYNPLLTIDSGAGTNTHNYQVIEVDLNNNDVSSTGATAVNGVDITTAGTHIANTALNISGSLSAAGLSPGWLYGIVVGGANNIQGADIELGGNPSWGLDTINFTGTSDIRLRNTGVIAARNGGNSADLVLMSLNSSNVLQLGTGAASINDAVRVLASAGQSINWNVNYGAGNTSAEAFMPFQSSQNPTGICNPDGAGNCVFNRIIIGSDNVDSSSGVNGTIAFQVNENCCLTSAKGTRNVGQFIINVIGTPADAAGNHSYVALETTARVAVNLGGTSTAAIANTSGSVFGANPYVSLASGATDLRGVIGQETDVEMATGSSAWAAVGQSVIATVNWTVKAAQENVGYEVASQSNSIHPFDVAYQIGGYEGWPGIDTTGGIMRCEFNQASGQCPGIGFGIDLSNIASISGYAFAGPNAAFNVTGTGLLSAAGNVNTGRLVESSIVTATSSASIASTTRYERCNSGSALSITFATTGMAVGQRIDVKNVNTGVCTVDSGSGHTIDGAQTFPLSTQYQNVSLLCTAVTSGTCTAWDVE